MNYLDPAHVLSRMRERGTTRMSWSFKNLSVVWEFIPVSQCRDFDGTDAGWPDRPGEEVLQKVFWRAGESPQYTNYWDAKL